jgi:uncharacterized ubiquitin-like protein YukD
MMTFDRFFDNEFLVSAWDGCTSSQRFFGKDILAISQHESLFIRITVDTRTYENAPFDLAVLECVVTTAIDDILANSEYLADSSQDAAWDVMEHEDFKALQRRFDFIGMQITLIDSALEFDYEEDYELMEVGYAYRGLSL